MRGEGASEVTSEVASEGASEGTCPLEPLIGDCGNNLKNWGKQKIAQTGNRPALESVCHMLSYEINVSHLLPSPCYCHQILNGLEP